MRYITTIIYIVCLNTILFSQETSIVNKINNNTQSIGVENDFFFRLIKNSYSLNNIIYPEYQFAFTYSKYFWSNKFVHGNVDFGLGTSKVTYNFDHQTGKWLTHNSLFLPLDISVLLGKRKNFLINGVGLFYNGQRIENVQLSDMYNENLEDVFFTKNTIYINYLMGYKRIIKDNFALNLLIISGRRDIFHFDLNYQDKRNIETCYPHYQIKIEYFF